MIQYYDIFADKSIHFFQSRGTSVQNDMIHKKLIYKLGITKRKTQNAVRLRLPAAAGCGES